MAPVSKKNFFEKKLFNDFILIKVNQTKNKTFNFCSVLTEISQKSFLSICHAPTIITLEKYLEVSVFKNS
jgi:hypothetical protein